MSVLVLVGCLCSQIPKIQIDVSPEALLRPNDPTRLLYNDFREQFGRPELIVIAIESPSIFSEMFLSRLKSLHQDLEDNVPFLYNFNKYYQKTGIVADAVAETMLGTGRALLMTSIILSSGFFILLVSSLSLLKLFGILTGITIVLALLADFLLVPALLRLAIKDHQP